MTEKQKDILIENMAAALPTLRKRLSVTQKDLSDMLGVSRSTVANIENKRQRMTWNMFLSLVFVFSKNETTDRLLTVMGIYTDEFKKMFPSSSASGKENDGGSRNYMVIANLAEDFECINYVEVGPESSSDIADCYRISTAMRKAVPGIEMELNFHNLLDMLAEKYVYGPDREKFIAATRRGVIFEHFDYSPVYFVNFRAVKNGEPVDSQIKFSADIRDGKLSGFVVGIHAADEESARLRGEQRNKDIIGVLSYEYNAVYYCEAETHNYDILFQQGFVKDELKRMRESCPRFEDAFRFFVEMLVHPDDREMMYDELSRVTETLQNKKSFKREFRRNYGGKYLYTELNCVKVGNADEPLDKFVVGFAENDAEYRGLLDKQKQLEYIVTERTAELQNRNAALNRVNEEIVELLGNITEARDLESGEHIRRVKGFSNILARQVMHDWPEYGLTSDTVELITSASALHDIGKIMIPDSILRKPGKLTPEEFNEIKKHCDFGCEILKKAPADWSDSYLRISYDICRYHHEKYDGSGYPCGLAGDAIPISAQIVSIADCFDALSTKRVYKDAYSHETAYQMILDGECGVFSGKILASFRACKGEMFRHAADTESEVISMMPAGLSTAALSWARILFCDDNEMSRELGVDILEGEGAEIVTASSGREAIELFEKSPDGYFDAVIMDVIMPGMDGAEATSAIRSLKRADAVTVPIIALTSLTTEDDVSRCLAAGMDSFMTKPIAVSSLMKVLYECLQQRPESLDHAVKNANVEAVKRIENAVKNNPLIPGTVRDYDMICYVNGNTNDIPAFCCLPGIQKILDSISTRLPSNRRLDMLFKLMIPRRDFKKFLEDTDRTRVVSYLEKHTAYHAMVPTVIDGKECLFRLKIVSDKDYPGNYYVMLRNMDTGEQEELRARELIVKLTESYLNVDYIDFEEDVYTRYHNSLNILPELEFRGNYGELVRAYTEKIVHEEDREMVRAFMDKNTLRERLSTHRGVQIRYRDIRSGIPRYCEMQFINVRETEESGCAIFSVADIDDLFRRDLQKNEQSRESRQQMIAAERRASRDVLTGVKNVTAYANHIADISAMLKSNGDMEFGVVVCNINDLSGVNETFGHDTGDIYIRNASRIICGIFTNSPVYRTGGDEFVIILNGIDYNNRSRLMDELAETLAVSENIFNIYSGKCSFSVGFAEYDSAVDSGVTGVVERATEAMYQNKRFRKKSSLM